MSYLTISFFASARMSNSMIEACDIPFFFFNSASSLRHSSDRAKDVRSFFGNTCLVILKTVYSTFCFLAASLIKTSSMFAKLRWCFSASSFSSRVASSDKRNADNFLDIKPFKTLYIVYLYVHLKLYNFMKGETVKCKRCGESFVKNKLTQIFCTTDCSYKYGIERAKNKIAFRKFRIMQRDRFKCFYCGKPSIEEDARLVLDHVISKRNGGTDTEDNLVTCCTECNSSKLGYTPDAETLARIRNEIKKRTEAMDCVEVEQLN